MNLKNGGMKKFSDEQREETKKKKNFFYGFHFHIRIKKIANQIKLRLIAENILRKQTFHREKDQWKNS
jgi:hypothetical protein